MWQRVRRAMAGAAGDDNEKTTQGLLGELVRIPLTWPAAVPISVDTAASRKRLLWGILALLSVAYVVAFAAFAPLTLQDYPNHLARAWVLSDLIFHHGARFGEVFQFHFLAIPYILGDLISAAATELLGPARVASLWSILAFLSLPAALLFYLRTTPMASEAKALLLVLSLYLATDWFFLVGFLEYRLGIAVTFVILALAERARQQPSKARYALYAGVALLGYLTHLTTLVFASALIGTSALLRLARRTTRLSAELWLLVPLGALFVWHFCSGYAFRAPGDLVEVPYIWDTLLGKLARIDSEFIRFGRADVVMMAALAVCVALFVGREKRRRFRHARVIEMFVLSGVSLAVYFALPIGYPEAYYVDIRALPLACLFALIGSLSAADISNRGAEGPRWLAVGLACLLVLGNLAYLARHLSHDRLWLTQYRSVIAAIPRNSRVLPVYTHAPDGSVAPFLHAFSFAMIDRDSIVPYLQTGDTGNPEKYLRYRRRPYAPAPGWYGDIPAEPVDWQAVGCDYDFLLVTKPYQRERLHVPLTLVLENDSAALLSLPRTACATALPQGGR
jgi:hypothetical protein